MNKIILIYITAPDLTVAKKVSNHLLKKRLIACANLWPIKSAYWWKGKIVNEKEVVCLCKTTPNKWNKIKSAVTKIHPYTIPCIIKLAIEANMKYSRWIKKEIK